MSNKNSLRQSIIFKVIVIGDACVGKTSFINRYVNGTFNKQYKGTIGVDFALKIVDWPDGDKIKIQLWDIAGQERFSYMTRVYYRDSHGCIIMFDVTNRSSFLNVVKWKRDLDSKCVLPNGQSIPCLLLANKMDADGQRQVTTEEIERLCKEFNFTCWAEISVKNNLMVEDSMNYFIRFMLKEDSNQAASTNGHALNENSSENANLRIPASNQPKKRTCC